MPNQHKKITHVNCATTDKQQEEIIAPSAITHLKVFKILGANKGRIFQESEVFDLAFCFGVVFLATKRKK